MSERQDDESVVGSMKRRSPLQRNVIIILVFVSIVLIAATAFESTQRSREIVVATTALQNEVARGAASQVRRFIADIERSMRSSAQSAVTAIAGLTESFEFELLDLLKAAPAVVSASAIDLDGWEIARVAREQLVQDSDLRNQSSSVAFQRARTGQTYFGRLTFVHDTQPYMTIAVPIEWFEGESAGVLVAEVNLHDISSTISEIEIGRDGYAYVISGDGELVAHPDNSLVLQRPDLSALGQIEEVLAGEPIAFRPHAGILGGEVYTVHSPVSDLGWSVLVEQPTTEIRALLTASISRLVLLLAIELAVVAAVGVLFIRRFVLPISALRQGAAQMVAGEFDIRISIRGSDEFEEIASALNAMAAQRHDIDRTLDEQVKRRAQELSAVLSGAGAFTRAADRDSPAGSDSGNETSVNNVGEAVEEAITLLEGALAKGTASDPRLLVALNTALCRAYVLAGRPHDALRAYETVVIGAGELGDQSTLLRSWQAITSARAFPELLSARLGAGERAVAFIGQHSFSRELGDLSIGYFADLVETGNLAKASDVASTALRLFSEHGDGSLAVRGRHMQLLLAMQKSVGGEIERAIDESRDEGVRQGLEDALGIHILQMFSVRRAQARVGALKPVVERLISDGNETFVWSPVLALLYCDMNTTGAARTEFERSASAGFDRIPRDDRWAMVVAHLCEVCAVLGDESRALALYELLQPHTGHNITTETICLGAADRYLGMLAATRRDWTSAEHHYEDALAFNDSSGLPIWRAHTLLDFAKALITRRDAGDQKHATELLDEALAASTSLGLENVRENCLALLSEKRSDGPQADGLSRRELRVLRLLASGATNRAIAEELFLSQHTVANHVRNILAKTNSANRTEAANYARQHSLVVDE